MFNSAGERLVRVVQYGSSYRSFDTVIDNGTIVIRDKDSKSKTIVRVEDNLVREIKTFKNNGYTRWIKYGEFEKARDKAVTHKIMHYRQKTSKGLHGLQVRKDFMLEGYPGTVYTFYSRGKFLWQKFVYFNKRAAYYVRWKDTTIKGMHPDKKPLFEIKVNMLYTKENKEGDPFIYHKHYDAGDFNFSADGIHCDYIFWDVWGRIKNQGTYKNNQRTGEWIEKYKRFFYLNGLPVPKAFYEKDPKDIPARAVLKIANSQVRAMFLKKVGYDRVIKECQGQIIHKDGNYELVDFPVKAEDNRDSDKILRILKVQCPSTKSEYFLSVPPTEDFNTCAKARNGTFTQFEPKAKQVEFAVET